MVMKENGMKRIREVVGMLCMPILLILITLVIAGIVYNVLKNSYSSEDIVYASESNLDDVEKYMKIIAKIKEQTKEEYVEESTIKFETVIDKENNTIMVREIILDPQMGELVTESVIDIVTKETLSITSNKPQEEEEPKKAIVKRYNGEKEVLEVVDANMVDKPFISPFGAGDEYIIELSQEDKEILATMIAAEAGNQTIECQAATGAVAYNRLVCSDIDFGDTLYDVIIKSGHFTSKMSEVTQEQMEACLETVDLICRGYDPTRMFFEEGAKYFYAEKGANVSGRKKVQSYKIGGHIFTEDFGK